MAINFPASPTEGQVFNVSPGKSFVFRGDGWVQAPMTTALPKNYLVNPSIQHSQQNGRAVYAQGSSGVAGTTAAYWSADQWQNSWSWAALGPTGPTFRASSNAANALEFSSTAWAP